MSAPVTWQTIYDDVFRRISERTWKPGELIPKESDLALELGCARATVNRALRQLADEGLLERRRKGGTRVAINPVRKATLDIPIIRHEIEARGEAYTYEVLSRSMAAPPKRVRARMRIGDDIPLLQIKTLHRSSGAPYMFEDRWINPASVSGIGTVNFDDINANEWLLNNALYTSGEIAFSAANASKLEAGLLNVTTGAALFVINRVTWNGPQSVTAVRLAYVSDYALRTKI